MHFLLHFCGYGQKEVAPLGRNLLKRLYIAADRRPPHFLIFLIISGINPPEDSMSQGNLFITSVYARTNIAVVDEVGHL